MDSVRFGVLGVRNGIKFTMIGTPEADSFKDRLLSKTNDVGQGLTRQAISADRKVLDDFDVAYPAGSSHLAKAVAPADDPRNKRKIQEAVRLCPITVSCFEPSGLCNSKSS